MIDPMAVAVSSAANSLLADLLVKQAAKKTQQMRATMRRYKAEGAPVAKTEWSKPAPAKTGLNPVKKTPAALPAPSASAAPSAPSAPASAARVVTPAEVLPAPKKSLVSTPVGASKASGATVNVGESVATKKAPSMLRRLLTPRNAAIAAGLGAAGYGLSKLVGKDKTAQMAPGKARANRMGPNFNRARRAAATGTSAPSDLILARNRSMVAPEVAAGRGMSRAAKLGLGGLGLGLAGYGAYRLFGKKKTASTVGQLSTASQEGAPTPPIVAALIKSHAKDHPGKPHAMPTKAGPAYPHVSSPPKYSSEISAPMLGKAASVRAFRKLAQEVLPV